MSNQELKPTEFVMSRDFMVKGFGHEIGFIKDVPIHVPPVLHTEAMRCGATPLDTDIVEHVQAPIGRIAEVQGEERAATITRAMDKMVADNRRMDFGANGLPTIKAIYRMTGIDIENNERDVVWRERVVKLNAAQDPSSVTVTKEETAKIAEQRAASEDEGIKAEAEAEAAPAKKVAPKKKTRRR